MCLNKSAPTARILRVGKPVKPSESIGSHITIRAKRSHYDDMGVMDDGGVERLCVWWGTGVAGDMIRGRMQSESVMRGVTGVE